MNISRVGGVIAAASQKSAEPLKPIGSITILHRVVITFQQVGIFPIIIVTGEDDYEIRHQLSPLGVIFLQNREDECPQLFDSVRIGFDYLKDKCDRVVFTPVNAPFFSTQTLLNLLESRAGIVTPTYHGRGGHPVVVASRLIDSILESPAEEGLRSALASFPEQRDFIEVEDAGIHVHLKKQESDDELLCLYNRSLLSPRITVSLEKENTFFNARLKLLLYLIESTSSVSQSCRLMALSIGKAWNMINHLEKELGYSVVDRRQGGSHGGKTRLTEKGKALLLTYQTFEDDLLRFARSDFEKLFLEKGLL